MLPRAIVVRVPVAEHQLVGDVRFDFTVARRLGFCGTARIVATVRVHAARERNTIAGARPHRPARPTGKRRERTRLRAIRLGNPELSATRKRHLPTSGRPACLGGHRVVVWPCARRATTQRQDERAGAAPIGRHVGGAHGIQQLPAIRSQLRIGHPAHGREIVKRDRARLLRAKRGGRQREDCDPTSECEHHTNLRWSRSRLQQRHESGMTRAQSVRRACVTGHQPEIGELESGCYRAANQRVCPRAARGLPDSGWYHARRFGLG